MASLKDIKNRIRSAKSTQKITRAMKMVAAAKVKRAENAVTSSRPFTLELNSMFKRLLASVGEKENNDLQINHSFENYPCLLKKRSINKVGLLVVTANKGLSGSYNANVIKKTIKLIEEYSAQNIKCTLFIVGQKGITSLQKKCKNYAGCEIAKTYYEVANNPTATATNMITEDIAEYFVAEKIDKIEIVTTRFKNMMSYYTENWTVLPLQQPEETLEKKLDPLMEFAPNKEAILQKIVPMYITNIIYHSLLEAQASELASRMIAMSAATSNADTMLHELSTAYNKKRQEAITQELTEVV